MGVSVELVDWKVRDTRAMSLERASRAEFNVLHRELMLNLGDRSYIIDEYNRNFKSQNQSSGVKKSSAEGRK